MARNNALGGCDHDERSNRQIGGDELLGRALACATVSASRRRSGVQVIKQSELPLETNRQGQMRWYLHPAIKDTVLSVFMFFQQEIPPGSRSGRLKFQGGQVIIISKAPATRCSTA